MAPSNAQYSCPNDGELMVLEVIAFNKPNDPATEQYRCQFCKFVKDAVTVKQTFKPVVDGYVAPSKKRK